MSVLAHLERLDHRLTGSPESPHVHESRKWRMRYLVISLLTFVSLVIALASSASVAGWLLVAFAVATGVKTALAQREWRAAAPARGTTGRWYEH